MTNEPTRGLTRKGMATRQRIVDAAAELIYERGVRETNNEALRQVTGVSGSQLSHYFPNKEDLIRAVISHRADSMRGLDTEPPRGPFDNLEAFENWAEDYITNPKVIQGGCSFGSLASEVLKSDPNLRDAIAEGFASWAQDFRSGLEAMQAAGRLNQDADTEQLTHVLMSAFQGGMLLAQAQRDVAPLRDALLSAVGLIRAASS